MFREIKNLGDLKVHDADSSATLLAGWHSKKHKQMKLSVTFCPTQVPMHVSESHSSFVRLSLPNAKDSLPFFLLQW